MKVLVLNCGSSSLKCQLIDMPSGERIMKGHYERIGGRKSSLRFNVRGEKAIIEHPARDFDEAIGEILGLLTSKEFNVISDLSEIGAVGHRIVNGGEYFKKSEAVTDEAIEELEKNVNLAPLHNPAGIAGIKACRKLLPDTPMLVALDTSFHQTMEPKAYIYALPYKYYEDYKIRKYGAHGISHLYVSKQVEKITGKKNLRIVNCHLGQGASLCAIKDGKSVDTTMGLTPLAGIPMGTRCGDVDPSIIPIVMKLYDISPDDMLNIMNKESGAWGISGVSTDFRDIEKEASEGDERSILALEQRAYVIAQYIAKMVVPLGGIDMLTFCGGIGENGFEERERICKYLGFLGIKLDTERNAVKGKETIISSEDSKVPVYVIPTNEEQMIANDVWEMFGNK
ncbi:MAG: acetate kinase [Clostridia bacterium]|nr:acetate kinase [Clostridia bacterium]